MTLKQITDELIANLDGLTFGPPVTHVYNPLLYARAAWDQYCEKFGQGPREVLLLSMNPGPYGLSNPYERLLGTASEADLLEHHPNAGYRCVSRRQGGAQ